VRLSVNKAIEAWSPSAPWTGCSSTT